MALNDSASGWVGRRMSLGLVFQVGLIEWPKKSWLTVRVRSLGLCIIRCNCIILRSCLKLSMLCLRTYLGERVLWSIRWVGMVRWWLGWKLLSVLRQFRLSHRFQIRIRFLGGRKHSVLIWIRMRGLAEVGCQLFGPTGWAGTAYFAYSGFGG